MALQPLSVGDVLMLSQQAWKIGRAFTQGKRSAPSEFAEVERESNGLSEALKLVAETLHTDGSVLAHADNETKAAVNTILESAHQTLSDLESFVERYQVIKKKETNGGFVVERSWSDVVLANYKTFKWTTEGGDISELRDMLQMHTNTINLTMQALQSRSLSRLEKTVMPMAENIASIHDQVSGNLGMKIDDLHRIIMAIANSTPSLVAQERAIDPTNSVRNSSSTSSTLEASSMHNGTGTRMLEAPPPRNSSYSLPMRENDRRISLHSNTSAKSAPTPVRPGREDSAYYSMGPLPFERDGRRMDWGFERGENPGDGHDIGSTRSSYLPPSPPSSRRESNIARRESATLPTLFAAIDEAADAEPGADDEAIDSDASSYARTPGSPYASTRTPTTGASSFARTPLSATDSLRSARGQPKLPPPAIPPDVPEGPRAPATPATFFGSPTRSRSIANDTYKEVGGRPQTAKSIRGSVVEKDGTPVSPNAGEAPSFEKALFRNSAILCDVRGTLIEYAQHIPDEPDPRFNTEMKEACKECRICVIRKRENREHGGTKVVTSIWAISDDGEVRLQQKLSDVNETVPYCSYFDPQKVSLPATDGDISLKFHSTKWGDPPRDEKKTNWVNFGFVSETDAVAFQSAVFGRTLIGSWRTVKTIVIHEGLKGAFQLEEQFAGIEMLRLFEDDGISTPGAAGGVLALMHISSNFGEGWARWWMNSSKQQVRVKDDSGKYAKVKGMDIMVVKPGSGASAADKIRSPPTAGEGLQRVDTNLEPRPVGGKRIPVKRVTGVKIEFKTEQEKLHFINTAKRCQEKMILLPDL